MLRHQLEHLIRAAGRITDRYEFIVVGSQSILGSVDRPPLACLLSNEADIYLMGAEELSDKIDGAIGEGSQFHDTYGYYAQGVDSSTATLPKGWESRLVRLQTQATDGRVAYCLDVVDLFMSKCAAARPKDREFNLVLLRAGLVDNSQALQLIHDMPIQPVAPAAHGLVHPATCQPSQAGRALGRLSLAAGRPQPHPNPWRCLASQRARLKRMHANVQSRRAQLADVCRRSGSLRNPYVLAGIEASTKLVYAA